MPAAASLAHPRRARVLPTFTRPAARTALRAVAAVLAAALVACAGDRHPVAPDAAVRGGADATARYIVVLRDSVRDVPAAAIALEARAAAIQGGPVLGALRDDAAARPAVYTAALKGYATRLTPDAVAALRADPRVAYVEPDGRAWATGTQAAAPWALDRIDQRALPLSTTYAYPQSGAGTQIYILDTGVRPTHTDFGGRVHAGYDALTVGGTAADCNGHGTLVASNAAGTTYGVAKAAVIVPVRVLGCDGQALWSTVITGIDWAIARKAATPTVPAVLNLSLAGDSSRALDDAVRRAVAAGIVVVAAAGNDSTNACRHSPGREPAALTVGAASRTDSVPAFSNVGSCVDLFAPGVAITGAGMASDNALVASSGTSMAAPHVAGAAALYLSRYPTASPAEVAGALTTNATSGALKQLRDAATPNRLLYVGFLPTAVAGDTPPVADFSVSCATYTCTFDARASRDDKGISSYAWKLSDNSTLSGPTATKTFTQNGTYTVTLTVTDAARQAATLTKAVVLNVVNAKPVAKLAKTCTKLVCTFDARPSTDDERVATYAWRFGDNTTRTGATVSKTFAAPKTWTVQLVVTDARGLADTLRDSVVIANVRPKAAGSVTCARRACTFASTSSDDFAVTRLQWLFGDSLAQVATSPTTKLTHTYARNGTYSARVIATDAAGLADTATVAVIAVDKLPIPRATVSCAARRCTLDAGTSTDDGRVVRWVWRIPGQPDVAAARATATLPAGVTTARVVITDDAGQTDSLAKAVTVTNAPPIATFTLRCTVATCTADASAASDDAKIVDYAFDWGDSTSVVAGASRLATHTYARGGSRTVRLTVRDADGASSTTIRTVTIDLPPTAALTATCQGLVCTFDGQGSKDDVRITGYAWTFGNGQTVSTTVSTARVTYSRAGTYTVTLKVTDPSRQTATATTTVTVR